MEPKGLVLTRRRQGAGPNRRDCGRRSESKCSIFDRGPVFPLASFEKAEGSSGLLNGEYDKEKEGQGRRKHPQKKGEPFSSSSACSRFESRRTLRCRNCVGRTAPSASSLGGVKLVDQQSAI